MYVDESGDCGLVNSPTRYFVLTGLVVHELSWQSAFDRIVDFRYRMRQKFGFRIREEFHAVDLVSDFRKWTWLKANNRIAMVREFADALATLTNLNVINIVIDKRGQPANYDVFENAWEALVQRFENTIASHNFPGPNNPHEKGMIFSDDTDDKKLTQLLRRMRRYNPVPVQKRFGSGYRYLPLKNIIEDPSFRNSAHSYFVQATDLCAYLLRQNISPNKHMRVGSRRDYFYRLDPILCKIASSSDPCGIVWL